LKYIFSLYCLVLALITDAQRVVVPVNSGWLFAKDADKGKSWQPVSLPHTWNVSDVMDDVPGYYRGAGWYKKNIFIDKSWTGKELYFLVEGANQEAVVFINGKIAGAHTGGYTAFYIPATSWLLPGRENELLIKVDNSHNRNIPPLTADFTFYGGLYRTVSLIAVNKIHFSHTKQGSKALYITAPQVSKAKAVAVINGSITNTTAANKRIIVTTVINDRQGKTVIRNRKTIVLASGENSFAQTLPAIARPHLWSPDDPYLYEIKTTITDAATGQTVDEIKNTWGFRWFRFDSEKGFFLNDKPVKLVGASRHQDYKGMGNAVPASLAIKDVQLLKEMGGNFLRVAHYPQDQSVLDACDSLGILASVEIPVVNEITETDSFYTNCKRMQEEMIRQNFNHTSVIVWCYMNEVLLKPQFGNDKERQKIYFASITRLARSLDSLTRREDPSRYTMIAHHGDFNKYRDVGLIDIPMIVGWNLYSGWYGSSLSDFPAFLDQFHKAYPAKPMMVTEYGADADPRIRSKEPVRFDKSVEYTTAFHQYYLDEMLKRPFVAGAMIWNLADFNSETRVETMPHINNKGLLEWDRTPKDPYYYYKAILAKQAFVKILGSTLRGGIADSSKSFVSETVQVASNLDTVELWMEKKSLGKKRTENGIASWQVDLAGGHTTLAATAEKKGATFFDSTVINMQLQQCHLKDNPAPFTQLNLLLGAGRFFIDSAGQLWIPGQPYQKGGWGYTGGKAFKMPNNGRLPYGTDKNIMNTNNDPVYQTQQTGIESYRLDLPAGEYELTLHFAELMGGNSPQLPYNLSTDDRIEPAGKRVFDVLLNGKPLLEKFNIAEQYGVATAVTKTVKLVVGTEGVLISFKAIEGTPVLNGLQVKKIQADKQLSLH